MWRAPAAEAVLQAAAEAAEEAAVPPAEAAATDSKTYLLSACPWRAQRGDFLIMLEYNG
jgi:hypothetical protein